MRTAFVLVLASCALTAQVTLVSDPFASTGIGANSVVRDSNGDLYSLVVTENANGDRPLLLQVSGDGGQTWGPTGFTFNDPASGNNNNATQRTNRCALAIDDQDRLHALWASYYYPSNFRQYYRSYEPGTGSASPIINVSTITGASVSTRTAAMDICVDGSNTVWIVAHGTSSWVERLVHSDMPYAAGGTFTDVGAISMTASAQNSRICVDMNGDVHCGYYRNISPGQYWHRIYTPGSGWNASTNIGNGSMPPHDYLGQLAADSLGNVHAIVAIDSGTPATTWKFRYKKWDAVNGWSPETVLFDATQAQYTGIANYRIFDIAVEAASGTVYAVYRDLSTGGALRLAMKDLASAAFSNLPDVTAPSTDQHKYYLPAFRGRLFPSFNQTGSDLDITWQHRAVNGTPPYDYMFTRVTTVDPCLAGTVGAGLGGPFDVLAVNGSTGGFTRTVNLAASTPVNLTVTQPPTNTLPANFVVVGQLGFPSGNYFSLPFGDLCFPAFGFSAAPGLFGVLDSFGLGLGLPASPAPFTLPIGGGIPGPLQFSLQGVIEETPGGLAITNGILVNVQ